MGKIIAITNQKGGVGKTTTTVNLGSCLGALRKKVLIIDMDSQGNATQGLGIDKITLEKNKKTTYDLLINPDSNVEDYVQMTEFANLYVIGSSQHLVAFDVDYQGEEQKEMILASKIRQMKSKYDYILIDCPPALNIITINALAASDSVLIPVQSEFYALEGMTQLLNTIKICKKNLNKKLTIKGILITMYSTNTRLSDSVYDEIKYYFTKYVYKTIIRRNISIAEAPSYGVPINYYDNKSNGAKDYMDLANEVIGNG